MMTPVTGSMVKASSVPGPRQGTARSSWWPFFSSASSTSGSDAGVDPHPVPHQNASTREITDLRAVVGSAKEPVLHLRSRRGRRTLRRYAPCSHFPRVSRRPCGPDDVSAPSRPGDGKPGPAAAGYGAQEGAPPATARRRGPRILGGASSLVAWMGNSLTHRQHRHRCPVKSGSIPTVLDSDLPQALSRPAAD